MYSYTFDEQTGGILLNSSPTIFSKEPRPVYASEMDLLEFDKYWEYDKQNDIPYLWTESNVYYYKGKIIAKIKGGDLYTPPEVMPQYDEMGNVVMGKEFCSLVPMDIVAMCEKNKDFLAILENTSVKLIVKAYEKYKNKLDIFHVAFSGGKDSAVLLDLVKKALPKGSFVVIFGDTGMEFPDTYEVVRETKKHCEEEGIPFYEAKSHLTPDESWRLFGPPARVLRWCCSVHKSTPQTLKMREITGKLDSCELAFVGVRKWESVTRSKYEVENYGKKQKGQYSYNPILEWTSAEIWLYMFANNIDISRAYKKGNSRAGCLMCPMNSGKSDYIKKCSYPEEINQFLSLIKETSSAVNMDSYIAGGGWLSRRNGRDIKDNKENYIESIEGNNVVIKVPNPKTDWKEWIKTIGNIDFNYTVEETNNGLKISFPVEINKTIEGKYFKQVFHKVAYCIGCGVCEANCRNGCISFINGLHITNCKACKMCHEIDKGCIVFHSLELPKQGGKNMKSINTFSSHAPKGEWIEDFLSRGKEFLEENSLGPEQISFFKTFLVNSGLLVNNEPTIIYEIANRYGWESTITWGILLTNLAYHNLQVKWYIETMNIGYYYERKEIEDKCIATGGVNPKYTSFIISAFGRLCDLPLGYNMNFGYVERKGKTINTLMRSKCSIDDNRILLYALYKFVEKCNMEKEFHISVLFDEEVERDGVSPVRIFGLYDEDELQSILLGLTARYPEFINATFTNDLKTITLYDKTSEDVLELFQEEF